MESWLLLWWFEFCEYSLLMTTVTRPNWPEICITFVYVHRSPSWKSSSSHSASQTPHLLWNLRVPYRVHKTPLILNHTNPINFDAPYLSNICFTFILPSTPRSNEWSLPFRFSYQNFVRVFHCSQAWHMSFLFHLL